MLAAFRSATDTGELTFACYSRYHMVENLLARNDPLDTVWDESQRSLAFVQRAGFRDLADMIVCQQRFVATMQGRTANFSTFSDALFDEAAFEAQLGGRMPLLVSLYWILKLKARFLSGDYDEALAAADWAKEVLWAQSAQIVLLDYFFCTALTLAALYEKASADEQVAWRDLLPFPVGRQEVAPRDLFVGRRLLVERCERQRGAKEVVEQHDLCGLRPEHLLGPVGCRESLVVVP